MAQKYDGSVIINTKIDDGAVDKNIKDLNKNLKSFSKSVERMQQEMNKTFTEYARSIRESVKSTENQEQATEKLTESHKKLNQEVRNGQKVTSKNTKASSTAYAQSLLDQAEKAVKELQDMSSDPLPIEVKSGGIEEVEKDISKVREDMQLDPVTVDTEEASKGLSDLSETAKESVKTIQKLDPELDDFASKASSLESQSVSITAEIDTGDTAEVIEGIREQTEDLAAETEELGTTVEDVYLGNADAMSSNADVLDELREKTEAMIDTTNELNSALAKTTARSSDSSGTKKEVHNTASQLVQDKLDAWLREAEEAEAEEIDIKVDTDQIDQAKEKTEDLHKEIEKPAEAKADFEEPKQEVNQLKEEIKEAKKELGSIKVDPSVMDTDEAAHALSSLEKQCERVKYSVDQLKVAKESASTGGLAAMKEYRDAVKEARSQVQILRDKLTDLANQKVEDPIGLEDIDKEIGRVTDDLDALIKKENEFKAKGDDHSNEWKELQEDIKGCEQSLTELNGERDRLITSGQGVTKILDLDEFQQAVEMVGNLENEVDGLTAAASTTGNVWAIAGAKIASSLGKAAKKAGEAAKTLAKAASQKIISGLKKVAKNAGEAAKNLAKMAGKSISNGIKKLASAFSKLFKSQKNSNGGFKSGLTSILKYGLGIRSLFSLISKLKSMISEGFGNLAAYDSKFNKTMSDFYSALAKLKNALATAFAPIVNVVLPYLTQLINYLTSATTKVAEFFAALTGQTTYTKAGDVQVDYAKDIAGTTKEMEDQNEAATELQRTLAGFDDVEILHENDNTALSTENLSNEISFETVPVEAQVSEFAQKLKDAWKNADFTEIGNIVGQKLKDALDNIPWDGINQTLQKIAKSIATFLNGFLETPGLFTSIGKTLAEALNAAFGFLLTFAENFHWESLGTAIKDGILGACRNINWPLIYSTFEAYGKGIAETLNAALANKEVWEALSETLCNGFNALVLGLNAFVTTLQWGEIGDGIAAGLNKAIDTINFDAIGITLANGWNGAVDLLYNVVTKTNWTQLGSNIAGGINRAVSLINWPKTGLLIAEGINSVLQWLNGFVTNLHWDELGDALGSCFNEVALNVDFSLMFTTLAEGLDGIALSVIHFAEGIQWEQLGINIANGMNDGIDKIQPELIGDAISSVLNAGINLAHGWVTTFKWDKFGETIGLSVAETIGNVNWEKLATTIAKFGEGLCTTVSNYVKVQPWRDIGGYVVNFIATFLSEFNWESVSDLLSSCIKGLLDFLDGIIRNADFSKMQEGFESMFHEFLEGVDWDGIAQSAGQLLGDAFKKVFSFEEGSLLRSVWDNSIFGKMTEYFMENGTNAGTGMLQGFLKGSADVATSANWMWDHIVQPFIDAFCSSDGGFDINSPSKVMADQAYWVGQGIVQGMNSGLEETGDWHDWINEKIFSPFTSWFQQLFKINTYSDYMYDDGEAVSSGFKEGADREMDDIETFANEKIYARFKTAVESAFGIEAYVAANMKDVGTAIVEGIKTGITEALIDIAEWVTINIYTPLSDGINSAFGIIDGICQQMEQYGKAVIAGIKQGIVTEMDGIEEWAKENIYDMFVNALDKSFQAKDFKTHGQAIVKGIKSGVETEMKGIKNWVEDEIFDPIDEAIKSKFDITGDESGKGNEYGQALIKGFESGVLDIMKDMKTWITNNFVTPVLSYVNSGFGIVGTTSSEGKNQGTYYAKSFKQAIEDTMKDLKTFITDKIVTPVKSSITEGFGINGTSSTVAKQYGDAVAASFKQGIDDGKTALETTVKTNIVDAALNALKTGFDIQMVNGTNVSNKAVTIGKAVSAGIAQGMKDYCTGSGLSSACKTVAQGIIDYFNNQNQVTNFNTIGKNVAVNISNGLSDYSSVSTVKQGCYTIAQGIIDYFNDSNQQTNFQIIGQNIGTGIYNGLISKSSSLNNLAANMAVNMYNSAANALDINSPSRLFRDGIGLMIALGLAQGITDGESAALDSVEDITNAMQDMADGSGLKFDIDETVTSGIDDVLTAFSDKINDSFLDLMDDLRGMASNFGFAVPAIAAGQISPYALQNTGSSSGSASSDCMSKILEQLEELTDKTFDLDDLKETIDDVKQEISKIKFYIGDEDLARHVNKGQDRLNQRLSTVSNK